MTQKKDIYLFVRNRGNFGKKSVNDSWKSSWLPSPHNTQHTHIEHRNGWSQFSLPRNPGFLSETPPDCESWMNGEFRIPGTISWTKWDLGVSGEHWRFSILNSHCYFDYFFLFLLKLVTGRLACDILSNLDDYRHGI